MATPRWLATSSTETQGSGIIGPFSSAQELRPVGQTHPLRSDEDITEPLPNALYEADPRILPTQLFGEIPNNLVWLDMMSDLATQDHIQLKESITNNLPITPLIAPVSNGGNWNSAGEPITRFLNKAELISALLGIDLSLVRNRQVWLERVQNTVKDEDLQNFLASLGKDVEVKDMPTRVTAIRELEMLVFGKSEFSLGKDLEITFDETNLKNLIAQAQSVTNKQAFIQIQNGNVKINGNVVNDIHTIPQQGDVVTIGKKVRIEIV